LNSKIRLALIKLQADKELGQSYAALYALNEGLHALNYLNDEDYQFFQKRYSDKLVLDEQQKKCEAINNQAQKEIDNMTRYFSMVIDQWNLHSSFEWRSKQLKKAKEYENRVPNAKNVIELAKKS
jgi:hypothetical protein